MGQRRLFSIFCFVIQIVALVGLSPATAATITVSTTNDSGVGSLRDAISTATAGDTIDFSVTGTIVLTSGELLINKPLTISGPGASNLIVSGNNASRVFRISAGNVNISSITIQGGSTASAGGGIWNQGTLTISHVVVSNNQATGGGGIYNSGTLTVNDSTISGNNIFCDCHAQGGGLLNDGTATLMNVTLTDNTADTTGNFGMGSWGGGISTTAGVTTLSKVTIAGNHAKTAGHGGGIAVALSGATLNATNCTISSNDANEGGSGMVNYGMATFTNVTISGNTAPADGKGAIDNHNQGSITLRNTIVANNPLSGNCSGTITSIGHNLSSDNTCGFSGTGDLINTDPLLGPLQDNGGPTFTHALLAGSPAIDAADPTDFPTTDQIGVTRPQGIGPDIGAYELLPINPAKGTFGTRFIITGSGFGNSKSTVYLQNGDKKVLAKVETWSDLSITCLWTKKLPAGSYPLFVQPKGKGVPPVAAGNFTIMQPSIEEITSDDGAAGDVITVNGWFFTNKKPKVYFEDPDTHKRKSCKVLSSSMDPGTGSSTLQFVIPKWGLDSYNLILINAIGQTAAEFPVDLYVDALNGNDPSPGTRNAPFKTITHALSVAGSNKTIKVRPGTYNAALGEVFPLVLQPGQVLIGDEANKGDGSTPTLIVGHGSVAGEVWSATIVGAEGSKVAGFKIGEDASPVLHAAVVVDGVTMQITNNTFKTPTYAGIRLENNGTSVIEDNVFDTSSYGVFVSGCPDGPAIRENTFLAMAIPIAILGINTYVVISNNTITGSGDIGVQVQHGHPLIENNAFNKSSGYTYGAIGTQFGSATPMIRGNAFACSTAIRVDDGNPDLGTVSDHGNNNFSAVTGASLTHNGAATVYAIGNTWPSTPPLCGTDIIISTGGAVIWSSGPGQQCP